MKKIVLIALSFLLLIIACQQIEYVTSVTLSATSMELIEGECRSITATVSPSTAENKNVIWTSSNASVATVTYGLVTACKEGTATITATTDDGGKTATCEVTVKARVIPVLSVALDRSFVELPEGDQFKLNATVHPSDATNRTLVWSSSNPSVASVEKGWIKAISAGNATITVTTEDGGKTATCEVMVNPKTVPVESVSLDRTYVEMIEGDELTLIATVNPDNATNKNVIWLSSDPSVASVADGKVTALNAGRTIIVVTTEDGGKTATCEVRVSAKTVPVTSVSLDKTSVELTEGDVLTLTATINPSNASNRNVTWLSSNSKVASVVNGKVTALKAGKATITVKTEDGGRKATCEVTVAEIEEDGDSNERLEENDGNW